MKYGTLQWVGLIAAGVLCGSTAVGGDAILASNQIRGVEECMMSDPKGAASIIGKTLDITPVEVAKQLPNIENPVLAHLGDVFQKSDARPPIERTYDASFANALQGHTGG